MTLSNGGSGRKRDGLRGLCAAWAVVAFLAIGCRTPEQGGGLNWEVIATQMDMGAADLRDVATLLDEEATRDALTELAAMLETASAEIDQRSGFEGDAIEQALAFADMLSGWLPEGTSDEVRLAVVGVKILLRRAQGFVGAESVPEVVK